MAKARTEASQGARERVLRVGLDLFSSKGFEGSGLREVATAAGVNHSLVLYHFGSMEGLWKAVVGSLLDEYGRRVQQRLAGLDAIDPVTRLKVGIEDFIRFSTEKPELHRIMTLEGRRRTERLSWLVKTYLKPMFEEASVTIARGQAEGTIRPFDPALLYYGFISLGATPSAFAPEIEAVTGRRTRNEQTIVELMSMVCTLVFTGETRPTAPKKKGKGDSHARRKLRAR
jgi:TetR/AcrR family transcriptional regulator